MATSYLIKQLIRATLSFNLKLNEIQISVSLFVAQNILYQIKIKFLKRNAFYFPFFFLVHRPESINIFLALGSVANKKWNSQGSREFFFLRTNHRSKFDYVTDPRNKQNTNQNILTILLT